MSRWFARITGRKMGAQAGAVAPAELGFNDLFGSSRAAAPEAHGAVSFWDNHVLEPEPVAAAQSGASVESGALIAAAETAETNGSLVTAAERWREARQASPDLAAGWIGECKLALRLGQLEEADALLREALARFPADTGLHMLAAELAVARKDWVAASVAWKIVLAQQPDDPSLKLQAARSLLATPRGRTNRAGLALEILRPLIKDHPDHVPALSVYVTTLVDAGELDAAWEEGRAMMKAAPANVELAAACANAAFARGAYREAAELLLDARLAMKLRWPVLEAALVRAWSQAGEHDLAEEVGCAALDSFPGESRIVEQHVVAAMRRGATDVAEQRARSWSAKYPDNLSLKKLLLRVAPSAGSPGIAKRAQEDLANLFMQFESLGAQQLAGCDFGGVQAHFGANPVSLLRWANMRLDGLIRALDCDFEGLGVPEHTSMKTRRLANGEEEYFAKDDRFAYVAHTFTKTHEAPVDQVFKQTLRRIRFLRDKLLVDLKSADRIFVFKVGEDFTLEKLRTLFASLRRHGPNRLLCVALSDAEHPPGTVSEIEPGLLLGRLEKLGGARDASRNGVDLAGWQSICQQAYALFELPDVTRATAE